LATSPDRPGAGLNPGISGIARGAADGWQELKFADTAQVLEITLVCGVFLARTFEFADTVFVGRVDLGSSRKS